ncbi:hypothetical protein BDK51DRAFT_30367, partial [Blyttiomyces helicus]
MSAPAPTTVPPTRHVPNFFWTAEDHRRLCELNMITQGEPTTLIYVALKGGGHPLHGPPHHNPIQRAFLHDLRKFEKWTIERARMFFALMLFHMHFFHGTSYDVQTQTGNPMFSPQVHVCVKDINNRAKIHRVHSLRGIRDWGFAALKIATGTRIRELTKLLLQDINFQKGRDGGKIGHRFMVPKNNGPDMPESRQLCAVRVICYYLLNHPDADNPDAYLFPTEKRWCEHTVSYESDSPLPLKEVHSHFKTVMIDAGLTAIRTKENGERVTVARYTSHATRRTFFVWAGMSGNDQLVKEIGRCGRGSRPKALMKYARQGRSAVWAWINEGKRLGEPEGARPPRNYPANRSWRLRDPESREKRYGGAETHLELPVGLPSTIRKIPPSSDSFPHESANPACFTSMMTTTKSESEIRRDRGSAELGKHMLQGWVLTEQVCPVKNCD